MIDQILDTSPRETDADTDSGAGETSYWTTNQAGEITLTEKAIKKLWKKLLGMEEKIKDPEGLRKSRGELEGYGTRLPDIPITGVNFETIAQRLRGINPNQAKVMKEILDMLTSGTPKENPVAPSTDQQHPKTDFQSPTIPSASFEDRSLK